jgi:antitoxin MazE3
MFMTTQIAVRLPDEMVEFVDQQVAEGTAPSRAAVVARALEREMRRQMAEKDAKIYASLPGNEFDSLADWTATQPMDID